ncbi:MAG TPA: M1 family metallopeptidase [Gemmatimonadales bacterium]|jgi:hypothetical protein
MTSPSIHLRRLHGVASALSLSIALSLWLAPPAAAQSLYQTRNFKQAMAKGTRSLDGVPGPNYWQNRARYTITVTALPPDRRIAGREEITYFNNSPDTLRSLVIKLFGNYHKAGAPRDGGTTADFLTSGVHIRDFAVNGTARKWGDNPRSFTWQPVTLPSALMPHDSVRLSFTWDYDVSELAGREGVIDSTTYYIAYFYPRVAVYDDYNGWDTMDHSGHEFYSDFNDYDVTFDAPANFVVWGTGTLTNAAQLLQPGPLARFQASLTSDSTIHIGTAAAIHAGAVTAQQPMNSWHFTAKDIPDMAFGLSDHYDWDGASVVVDDATHRRASVQAAYNDSAADFHQMVQFGRHSLDFLSHQWPGVPYPYEKTTEFQGGAGMEYPMMANDESYPTAAFAQFVAAHEIAHTYMPFYMGTNETRYAFMDEGWATTFEYLINQVDMGVATATTLFQQFRVSRWAHDPSPSEDLPIITPADALAGGAYGINAYGKPALGYLAVKDMLGDVVFKKSLHAWMDRWHGKHPSPWDFFDTFDNTAGQNLDWFWTNWFFGNAYIDLGVKSVTKARGGYAVVISNIGGMDAPVDLRLEYNDGSHDLVHETSAIWKADQRQATVMVRTGKALKSVTLDGGIWMDADATNNSWKAK